MTISAQEAADKWLAEMFHTQQLWPGMDLEDHEELADVRPSLAAAMHAYAQQQAQGVREQLTRAEAAFKTFPKVGAEQTYLSGVDGVNRVIRAAHEMHNAVTSALAALEGSGQAGSGQSE